MRTNCVCFVLLVAGLAAGQAAENLSTTNSTAASPKLPYRPSLDVSSMDTSVDPRAPLLSILLWRLEESQSHSS